MAILKIARMGHPVLKARAEPVPDPKSQEIQQLVRDMVETLEDVGGIGLAAPQVHVSKRVVIFYVPGDRRAASGEPAEDIPLTVLINP
jgi:peptide deformylase